MTIFKKIFSVYLLLIILGFSVGLLGIYHFYRLNQITQSILAQDILSKQLQTQLMDTFLSQVRYERQYRILGDAELVKFFDDLARRFQKTLIQLEGIAADPDQKEHAVRLRDLHYQYSQLLKPPAGRTLKDAAAKAERQSLFNMTSERALQKTFESGQLKERWKIRQLAQSAIKQTLLYPGSLSLDWRLLVSARRATHPSKGSGRPPPHFPTEFLIIPFRSIRRMKLECSPPLSPGWLKNSRRRIG
jgi:hypothetical protein